MTLGANLLLRRVMPGEKASAALKKANIFQKAGGKVLNWLRKLGQQVGSLSSGRVSSILNKA